MNIFPLDKIYSQIKSETNKYSDISNVYQKLQDSGYVKNIYELIHQIFIQEKRYTFDEISKIMQAYPNKKINLESQLRLNGAIFKTNFHLIVGIIIDMISNDIYNLDPNAFLGSANNSMSEIGKGDKMGLSQKSLNLSTQKIVSPSNKSPQNSVKNTNAAHRSNFNTNQPQNIINNSMKLATREERQNPRMNNTKVPQGLSTSMVVTRNDARAFKKKKQINNKGEPINNNNTTSNNMSFLSQKNPRLNQSTNSLYCHSTVYPNLDSEFSYIGGKSTFTFPRTERMKEQKDISPGPKYDPERAANIVRNKSPEVKFDKAEKTSWFDEKFKQGAQSPGFVYNPSKHFASK